LTATVTSAERRSDRNTEFFSCRNIVSVRAPAKTVSTVLHRRHAGPANDYSCFIRNPQKGWLVRRNLAEDQPRDLVKVLVTGGAFGLLTGPKPATER